MASGTTLRAYSKVAESYETLIQGIRCELDKASQAALDAKLEDIRRHTPHAEPQNDNPVASPHNGTGAVASPPTYVGKASDIYFIHSVRQCVQGPMDPVGDAAQNYSQTHSQEISTLFKYPLLFPPPAEAEQFLDVYLSTIHIAYPFMCKSALLEAFQRFQNGDIHHPEFRPWLALFSKISIGKDPFVVLTNSRFHFRDWIVLHIVPSRKRLRRPTSLPLP